MTSVPERRNDETPSEAAERILAEIPEPEMDALCKALARLWRSAARNGAQLDVSESEAES